MRDRQPPKRLRASIDKNQLSPDDQLAFERVASLLQKPLSELYEERSNIMSSDSDPDEFKVTSQENVGSQVWSTPQWENLENWQHGNSQMGNDVSNSPHWAPALGAVEVGNTPGIDCTQWINDASQAPAIRQNMGAYEPSSVPQRSSSWSHEATIGEPWISVPTEFLAETGFQDGMTKDLNSSAPLSSVGGHILNSTSALPRGDILFEFSPNDANHGHDIASRSSCRPYIPARLDQLQAVETEILLGLDWEHLEKPDPPSVGSQNEFSSLNTKSGWSLVASSKAQAESTEIGVNSMNAKPFRWASADTKEEQNKQKAQRRGPFVNQQLREETSNTRKLKACVRCRMQKIRCQININDPSGVCQTCQEVSKQRVHTLPCVRHKLTDCVIYRTGKAPGLEFTFRWPEMKLKDITQWSSDEIRTIKVQSDLCDTPLQLTVKRFVPTPQDSMRKSWMDGKKKKFKETTPFAIVNMTEAVRDMGDYINKHIFECVAYWLRGKDEWVQETYKFARKYMLVAPPDEAALLGDTFRLWFAIRRTATTEFIVGNDTLDMVPETKDRSYPLFGKVPLPPVMIQQLDMILTLGFLKPLRKKFLEDFQKLTMSSNPKSWMAIYLITFIACHSCAAVTNEHYKNARKHGLKRKYAMPKFISERHHSANVYLYHYHYCTSANNPFYAINNWNKRETTQFADMSTAEFHFLRKSMKMLKEREDQIRDVHEFGLYEDDLYFVSQMHEKNWTPRDTVIDYSEGTVGDVPLKQA